MTASIFPAITFFIGVVALWFYGISRELNLRIQDELIERRKSFSS
jgi:Na+/melibiose symporter-like transporter